MSGALLSSFRTHAGGRPTAELDTARAIRAANPTQSGQQVSRVDEAAALVVYSARGVRDLT